MNLQTWRLGVENDPESDWFREAPELQLHEIKSHSLKACNGILKQIPEELGKCNCIKTTIAPKPNIATESLKYPLARNQYMNHLPESFTCIRASVNTGAICIRTEMSSLKNLANMQRIIPHKNCPVFARVRMQAPCVFAQKKLIHQEFFSPASIGFVPGGYSP